MFLETIRTNDISSVLDTWVNDGAPPEASTPIVLGKAVYLYRGGPDLFHSAALSAQYGLVRKLYRANGSLVGYAFFGFDNRMGHQVNQIAIFEKEDLDGETWIARFPSAGLSSLQHPLNDATWTVSRYAVAASKLPQRRSLVISVDEACKTLSNETPGALLDILTSLGCFVSDDFREIYEEIWHDGVIAGIDSDGDVYGRLPKAFSLFEACFFETAGTNSSIYGMGDWPFAGVSYPMLSGNGNRYDLNNKYHRAAIRNLLAKISMHAGLFQIDDAQRRSIDNSLVKLGNVDNAETAFKVKPEFWVGKTENGRSVYCSGVVQVADAQLHIVNIPGGILADEIIYQDQEYRKKLGPVTASMHKNVDHSGFVKPELQNGIGIIVNF